MEANRKSIQDVREAVKAKKTGEVIIPNEVVNLHFPDGASLSLLASKLFVQLVETAGVEVGKDKEHSIPIADINWSHRDNATIVDTVRELQRTLIEIDVVSRKGRKAKRSVSILAHVDREVDDYGNVLPNGEIAFKFSDTFRKVIADSKYWAAIHAKAALAMEGKYTVWLYQLCAMLAGRKESEFFYNLDDLKARLGANAPSMKTWQNFQNRALEPAIAEINHLSELDVDYKPEKRGRKVIGITLFCGRKTDKAAIDAAHRELNNVRTGRKARRTGMVEKIAEEKAALKSKISGSTAH